MFATITTVLALALSPTLLGAAGFGPSCCVKNAYCCSVQRDCCPSAKDIAVGDEVAQPTCCAKRAYCCTVKQACCAKEAVHVAALKSPDSEFARQNCCLKRAYCCTAKQACCGGKNCTL